MILVKIVWNLKRKRTLRVDFGECGKGCFEMRRGIAKNKDSNEDVMTKGKHPFPASEIK